jgi:hypothetical protein
MCLIPVLPAELPGQLGRSLSRWQLSGPVKTNRNPSLAECLCDPPRKIRVNEKTFAIAPIICGRCGQQFTLESKTSA